ncbi:MAG: ATP-binding protein [Corallococcus sp.]|nr:ATP-binding protein [Corallococcus sp.]MCM1359564.1 ATP-binding protein [Corallococcus sp.]MCM1395156.1 ATP-binding protein [Corallococcus sp.]
MMNREQLALAAKRKIDARRLKALALCDRTLEDLRKNDDYKNCERALREAQVKYVFERDDKAKKDVEKYGALQKKLLNKYGLTEADLLPKYHCAKCEDTGYFEGKYCACMQEEISKLLLSESNVQSANFTFESSSETNKHNLAVYKQAHKVCLDGTPKNIMLTGGTGCGKTYLLSACANLCAKLGKSVLFVTAYNLNSKFLECHLSDFAEKKIILDNLTETDVLIIDDLGTEIVYKNVTAEYLFEVINERIVRRKQTFFSTNLSLSALRDRYDERIFSRIVDKNTTLVAKLEGSDKRTGIEVK